MISGSLFIAAIWLLRIAAPYKYLIYITAVAVGLINYLIALPLDAKLIQNRKTKGMLDVSTFRNADYMFAHACVYVILYFAVDLFNLSFWIAVMALLSLAVLNWIFMGLDSQIPQLAPPEVVVKETEDK